MPVYQPYEYWYALPLTLPAGISQHRAYLAMLPIWLKCRTVLAGQDAIMYAGELYLPKLPGQSDDDYEAYQTRSTFYDATYKTQQALIGMACRKPPSLIAPPAFKPVEEVTDTYGNDIWQFTSRVLEVKTAVGRVGILVDRPMLPLNATRADELAMDANPKLYVYSAEDILNWSYDKNNQLVYVLLRRAKYGDAPTFDRKEEFIELKIDEDGWYRYTLYSEGQIEKSVTPTKDGSPMNKIPFFFCDSDDLPNKPPLYDIVNLNVRHYQLYADYAHLLHYASIPTLVISGMLQIQDSFYIGSEKAIVLDSPGADAKWIKCGSDGAAPIKSELEELENRMASLGAQILQDRVSRETAQAAQLRNAYNTATLVNMTQEVSAGIQKSLRFAAWWMGIAPMSIQYAIDLGFNNPDIDAQTIQQLLQAYTSGAMSLEVFVTNMHQAGFIPAPYTLEEELVRLKSAPKPQNTFDIAIKGSQATQQPME